MINEIHELSMELVTSKGSLQKSFLLNRDHDTLAQRERAYSGAGLVFHWRPERSNGPIGQLQLL